MLGVEYSLSSLGKSIGSVAIDSSSSSMRNAGVMSAMALFFK